ncbi:MAG: Uma2 family endonuclease [Ruminococcus sp.]|jgi:Uma2 family endonuclease|nr:Uma2 family endonuclease [Ruminococcus sp.]
MDLREIKYYKELYGYTDEMLAQLTGVSSERIKEVIDGRREDCDIIERLEQILLSYSRETYYKDVDGDQYTSMVREEAPAYGSYREKYTIEDYYRLPNEERKELINGTFYDMAAPSISHQLISMNISVQIAVYIREKRGDCLVLTAPVDVRLDEDEYTMIQPDIIILCKNEKLHRRCIMGAPDFIIEILSPSTGKKDAFLKLAKYRYAGVREYWMIDPEKKRIVTYFFEEDEFPVIYGMDRLVPVRIYNGELKLDFGGIQSILKELALEEL